MKNPNVPQVLRAYRKKMKLSVNQVSELLKESGNYSAPKTIYGWETGKTQPDADTLMSLCKLYGIENVLEEFGYKSGDPIPRIILSEDEQALIAAYRSKPQMHSAIKKLLDL